ncbi:MAG: efflux RND transporter periplasmic adaptor subunit [Deltaproteobacteria bacterium]|nr:efflux RND transporter periplasmic adaptor subunit [Deltaproteobacteria bacterium]
MRKKGWAIIIIGSILMVIAILYLSKTISVTDTLVNESIKLTYTNRPSIEASLDSKDLTPTSQETPVVEILPERQRLIGVKTTTVAMRPLRKVIRTVGRVEYDERKLFTVNTKFEGWIEKLYVDYKGRYVRKRKPLADIYSPDLLLTQKEYINAIKWLKESEEVREGDIGSLILKDARAIVEAVEQRLRLWDLTDEQIGKIKETGRPLRIVTIFSPVTGYVIEKPALQGMRVMPKEKLFDIADLSTVWVVADIYEHEVPLIKAWQKARISLSYIPNKEFLSKIEYIYPTLETETKTLRIRFTIPNPDGLLKPQMFTNVEINVNLGNRLAIPEDAIIDSGTRHIVYVDKGQGYFEPREVILGLKGDGLREVIKGLKLGEKVASSATFLIDAEAKLKGVRPLEK